MALDPRQLRILPAAVRAGSLSGAARELNMSQPAIPAAGRHARDQGRGGGCRMVATGSSRGS